jgi:hypothetical protein
MTDQNHKDFRHLSSDELLNYQSNQLTKEDKARIELHLASCELCSDALKGFAGMNDTFKIYSITREIKQRIKKRKSIRRKIFSQTDIMSVILIVFIIGLIILLSFYFFYLNY